MGIFSSSASQNVDPALLKQMESFLNQSAQPLISGGRQLINHPVETLNGIKDGVFALLAEYPFLIGTSLAAAGVSALVLGVAYKKGYLSNFNFKLKTTWLNTTGIFACDTPVGGVGFALGGHVGAKPAGGSFASALLNK